MKSVTINNGTGPSIHDLDVSTLGCLGTYAIPTKNYNFSGFCKDGIYLKEVLYNYPATIAFWSDGTKTVVKPNDDAYSAVGGLLACFVKKFYGREGFNTFLNDWLPEEFIVTGNPIRVTLGDVMKKHKR